MRADAVPLLTIFDRKLRLEVPLFQRQYVWSQAEQWEPLWDDIARKFSEYLDGRKDAPIHFLGAMVLDQKQTPITHVEKRQVIDGQQRLTTLQIFLASFRDFCRAHDCEDLAKECDNLILNKGMMADPKVDKFKVWRPSSTAGSLSMSSSPARARRWRRSTLSSARSTTGSPRPGRVWSRPISSSTLSSDLLPRHSDGPATGR